MISLSLILATSATALSSTAWAAPVDKALGARGGLSAGMRSRLGTAAEVAKRSRGTWVNHGIMVTSTGLITSHEKSSARLGETSQRFDTRSSGKYLPAQRWDNQLATETTQRASVRTDGKLTTATVVDRRLRIESDNGWTGYPNPQRTASITSTTEKVSAHLGGLLKIRHTASTEKVTFPDGRITRSSTEARHLLVGQRAFRLPSFR